MASKYGATHGLKGYDKFRTHLTYRVVYGMLMDFSDDPKEWRYKKKGTVLGFWHQLKMEMWERHLDEQAKKRKKRVRKRTPQSYDPAPF